MSVVHDGAPTRPERLDAFEWSVVALFIAIAMKDGILLVRFPFQVNLFYFGVAVAAILGGLKAFRAVRDGWRPKGVTDPALWVFGAPFLAGLWSVIQSADRPTTFLYSLRLMVLWLVAALVISACAREVVRLRALTAFVIGAVGATAVGYLQRFVPTLGLGTANTQLLFGESVTRPAGFYLDANFYGMYLAAACLVALGLAAVASTNTRRVGWLVAAAVMVPIIISTYSRTVWLGLGVGIVMMLVLSPWRVRVSIVAVIAVSVAIGVAFMGSSGVSQRAASIAQPTKPGSNATRYLMARASVSMMLDRPVFGTGLEAYDDVYPAYRLPGAETEVSHPHQLPLAFIVETGIAGLLAEIVLALLLAWRSLARLRRKTLYDVGLVAALVAIALGTFLQYFLYYEVMWLLAALICVPIAGEAVSDKG